MVRELRERVIEFGIDGGEPATARDDKCFVVWFGVIEADFAEIAPHVVKVVSFTEKCFVDSKTRGNLGLYPALETFRSRGGARVKAGDSAGVVESVKELFPEGEDGAAVTVCVV
jgi:hypothetical protein